MRGRSIHCLATTRRYDGCTTGLEPAVALSAARLCCARHSFGELMATRLGSNQPWPEWALESGSKPSSTAWGMLPIAAKMPRSEVTTTWDGPSRPMTLDGAGSQPAGDVREGRLRVWNLPHHPQTSHGIKCCRRKWEGCGTFFYKKWGRCADRFGVRRSILGTAFSLEHSSLKGPQENVLSNDREECSLGRTLCRTEY